MFFWSSTLVTEELLTVFIMHSHFFVRMVGTPLFIFPSVCQQTGPSSLSMIHVVQYRLWAILLCLHDITKSIACFRNWYLSGFPLFKGVMSWPKVSSLVYRFWSLPRTNGHNTQLKWKLRYSPIQRDPLFTQQNWPRNRKLTQLLVFALISRLTRWCLKNPLVGIY